MQELNQEMEAFFGGGGLGEGPGAGLGAGGGALAGVEAGAQARDPRPVLERAAGEGRAGRLSHIDHAGRASMVDVSRKGDTVREARAGARVHLGVEAFQQVFDNTVAKGDVLTVAKLAGIMASKRTAELIPLCHPLPLDSVHVELRLDKNSHSVDVVADAKCTGPTGVEMEALMAASVAGLTVYDMCKAVGRGIQLTDVRLLRKSGGRSGDFRAD